MTDEEKVVQLFNLSVVYCTPYHIAPCPAASNMMAVTLITTKFKELKKTLALQNGDVLLEPPLWFLQSY